MFGKILKTPEASLAFRMMKAVSPQQKAKTQTQAQKKKKKPAAGRGGVRARRGGAGKRSLLDVS